MMYGHLFQFLTKLLVVLTPNTKTGQLMSQHILVSAAFLEEGAHQNARKVKLEHMSHDDICCISDP
jgi:hypothetical protein